MKEGTVRIHGSTVWATFLVAAFVFLLPAATNAATLFLSPSNGSYNPGQTFTVAVRTNTQSASVNAAEAVVRFDPAKLRVISVSGDNTIFNLNVQQPDFSNAAGTVTFAGVVLNPGYIGASGNLLTITFEAVAPGQTTVQFASGAVLANDGQGTNVLNGLTSATFTVLGGASPTPTPSVTATPVPGSPQGPLDAVVTSPTHPDQDSWYASNDVVLNWNLPGGVEGVSWLLDPKEGGNPGNLLDGLVSTVTFDDVDDGETYFHLKLRRDGRFGPIAHFRLRIDTEPPEPFEITRIKAGDPTDPQPWFLFETSDVTSGIQQYRMRIGDGDWFDVPEATPERPFQLPIQAPGTHDITVEALDAAGLSSRAQYSLVIDSIRIPVIVGYPESAPVREPFIVTGTAADDTTVTVRAYLSGSSSEHGSADEARMVQVRSDSTGSWRASVPGLETGSYELEAIATDARGATSYPSERVDVQVGSWYVQLSNPAWVSFLELPLWLRWFLPLLLLANILFFLFWRRRRLPVAVIRSVTRTESRIEGLIHDIESEQVTLELLRKSRPLYPEEKHLEMKLESYREALVKIAKSGEVLMEEVTKVKVQDAPVRKVRVRRTKKK